MRARVAESVSSQKADVLPRLKENACLAVLTERLVGDVPPSMAEDSETSLLQDFFQQLQHQGMSFDTYLMQQGLTSDQFKEDIKKQALDSRTGRLTHGRATSGFQPPTKRFPTSSP